MKRFLLLFTLMLSLATWAVAEEVTVTYADLGYNNAQVLSNVTTQVKNSNGAVIANITYAKGSATTAPTYYNTGGLRLYVNGRITITAINGVVLTKAEFVTSGKNNLNGSTVSEGTFANSTWTGNSESFTLTCKSDEKHARVSSITITYEETATKADTELSYSAEEFTYTIGEENGEFPTLANPHNLAVTYESSKESVATVDNNGNVRVVGAGSTVITATYAGDNTYYSGSASYTLKVVDPNAITAFVKLTDISELEDGSIGVVVCETKNVAMGKLVNSYGSNIDVSIVDNRLYDVGEALRMEFVAGTGSNNDKFAIKIDNKYLSYDSSTKLTTSNTPVYFSIDLDDSANAQIYLTSTRLLLYSTAAQSNNFRALATDNTGYATVQLYIEKNLTPVNPDKGAANLKFEGEGAYTVANGDEFTAPELTKDTDGAVTYSSSNTEVATVDAENGAVTIVGVGTTTITATAAETATYNAGSASYTLTVVAAANSFQDIYDADGEILVNFPMTVTYVNGANTFVKYNDTYGLIYKDNLEYQAGDVIPAGWTAKHKFYKGLPEIEPVGDMPASTERAEFEIAHVSEITADMVNQVVTLNNVTFAEATPAAVENFTGTVGEVSYQFRNKFKVEDKEAGTYNVVVAVGIYNEQLQLYVIAYEDIVPEPEVGMVEVNFPVDNENIIAAKGATVVFQAANADGMQLTIEEVEEPLTCEGDTYMYTVTEDVIVTVTPIRGNELLNDKAEMYMISLPEKGVSATNVAGIVTLKVEGVTEKDEVAIYYMITPTGAAKAIAHEPIEGYTEYTEPLTMDKAGTISAYAVVNGVAGDVATHEVTKDQTTGVEDITVDNGGEVEYFDLQGRAVANPRGGIFIRRSGGTTVKVAL